MTKYIRNILCVVCGLIFIVPTMQSKEANKKIGICLSGGGAIGFAHLGVLQALEENNIKPQYVSGSSMGALIGTLYAAGYSPSEIMVLVEQKQMYKITNFVSTPKSRKGLSSMKNVQKIMLKYIPHNNFEMLHKKLYLCVANLTTGRYEIISSGKQLSEYVCASAAIPIVFEPQEINGNQYADGGLLNNLPAEPLRQICDIVIGVDVLEYPKNKKISDKMELLNMSILVNNAESNLRRKEICDYYISCNGASKYTLIDYKNYKELYKIGYDRTIEYIKQHPEIKDLAEY
ncbi:MAG: hypothetical protein EOL95_04390 [Bacteroidia bacterium]|nr:hypothetical protein [Bacteroidia bacterium]